MFERIFQKEKIKTNATKNRTREMMTQMADDTKTRHKLFTGHLKMFGGRAKVLKSVFARHRSKVTTNESVNIIHE